MAQNDLQDSRIPNIDIDNFRTWKNSGEAASRLEDFYYSANHYNIKTFHAILPDKDADVYRKTKQELTSIDHILDLDDSAPEFSIISETGLTASEYRSALYKKRERLRKQMDELNTPVYLINEETLLYAFYLFLIEKRHILNEKFSAIDAFHRECDVCNRFKLLFTVASILLILSFACCVKNARLDRANVETTSSSKESFSLNAPKEENLFYATPKGEKYHIDGCISLDGKSDIIKFESEEDAKDAGYEPCKICISK